MKNKYGKFAFPVSSQLEVDTLSNRLNSVLGIEYRDSESAVSFNLMITEIIHLNYWDTDKDVLSEGGSIHDDETTLSVDAINAMSDSSLKSILTLEEDVKKLEEINLTKTQMDAVLRVRRQGEGNNFPVWNLLRGVRDAAQENGGADADTVVAIANELNGREREVDFIKFMIGEPTTKFTFVVKDNGFIIRSKYTDGDGDYSYYDEDGGTTYFRSNAHVFATREEAESAAGFAAIVEDL